jgi:23S rRNA U2552 (ribose-2'-O)-methylase RlmE/FtsJ
MPKRTKSSRRWLDEHFDDPYVKRAQAEGWRSRAVYKLEEIDAKHRLFKGGERVLDLGCRPGSWLQYAASKVGHAGALVGIDRQPLDVVIPGARIVVGDVFDVLADRTQAAVEAGIPSARIAVDPGIGFGKTLGHNLELLRRLRELASLGRPVVVGVSRKGFIGELTGANDPLDRLEGSLAAAALSVGRGARIVRVHDVAATVRAVRVADAIATAELA